jgi:hypothetical protein
MKNRLLAHFQTAPAEQVPITQNPKKPRTSGKRILICRFRSKQWAYSISTLTYDKQEGVFRSHGQVVDHREALRSFCIWSTRDDLELEYLDKQHLAVLTNRVLLPEKSKQNEPEPKPDDDNDGDEWKTAAE